jgi:hypothetical protein
VRLSIVRLASEDAAQREQARVDLIGLGRADLPVLRQAIRSLREMEPSQTAVLRDIVTHVYLTGEPYSTEGGGFLGIRLPHPFKPEEQSLLSLERGVALITRFPGFCAFRMLRDGDVILSVTEESRIELKTPDQLIEALKSVRPGQTITFEVVRQGQIVNVPITLDRRPINLQNSVEEFLADRARAADKVWDRDFAPLLENRPVVSDSR